jgi:hypothetical protein
MPLATAALLFVHASHHYDASDMSRTVIFRDYGLEMLRAIPDKPRVLLLTLGDEVLNAARYVHRQLGVRPQLTILDQNYVQFDWFVRRIRGKGEYAQLELPGMQVLITALASPLAQSALAAAAAKVKSSGLTYLPSAFWICMKFILFFFT